MFDPGITQDDLDDLRDEIQLLKDHLPNEVENEKHSISSRLLILHYSSALNLFDLDRDDLAEFIRPLVGATGIVSLKKYLSRINKPDFTSSKPPFTVIDLKRAYEHFEKAGKIEICEWIQRDIDTLKNRGGVPDQFRSQSQ